MAVKAKEHPDDEARKSGHVDVDLKAGGADPPLPAPHPDGAPLPASVQAPITLSREPHPSAPHSHPSQPHPMQDIDSEKKDEEDGAPAPSQLGYMTILNLYAHGSPSVVENIVSSISIIVLRLSLESSHCQPWRASLKNVLTQPVSKISVSGAEIIEMHPPGFEITLELELELELELDRLELEELLDDGHSSAHLAAIPGHAARLGSAQAAHMPLQSINLSR